MCEIILNKDDYGFVLINKICNQNQPTLKHLKERIYNLTDIRLKKRIILRLISWAFENTEHTSRHWKQLSTGFLAEFGKEISAMFAWKQTISQSISHVTRGCYSTIAYLSCWATECLETAP